MLYTSIFFGLICLSKNQIECDKYICILSCLSLYFI